MGFNVSFVIYYTQHLPGTNSSIGWFIHMRVHMDINHCGRSSDWYISLLIFTSSLRHGSTNYSNILKEGWHAKDNLV